jgi:DNA-binding transcriptional LysR family regulator
MSGKQPRMSNIKFHYLEYFAVLAEELHFGRAADRLAITQPPLSAAIKTLEEVLGVRLLERDSKHVQLTPGGTAFLLDVHQILESMTRAVETTKAVASGLQGRLDIGVTGSMFYREVPHILELFNEDMPLVEVTLREMSSGEQVEALLHDRLHAGFLNAATVPPQLSSVALKDDRFVCCLPDRHALASARSLRLEQLADERFVMFSRDVARDNHDNVMSILRSAGVSPRTHHAARQWLTMIAMVANNMGVALVPSALAHTGMRGVRFVALSEKDAALPAPALLAWNPGKISGSLQKLVDCTQQILAG